MDIKQIAKSVKEHPNYRKAIAYDKYSKRIFKQLRHPLNERIFNAQSQWNLHYTGVLFAHGSDENRMVIERTMFGGATGNTASYFVTLGLQAEIVPVEQDISAAYRVIKPLAQIKNAFLVEKIYGAVTESGYCVENGPMVILTESGIARETGNAKKYAEVESRLGVNYTQMVIAHESGHRNLYDKGLVGGQSHVGTILNLDGSDRHKLRNFSTLVHETYAYGRELKEYPVEFAMDAIKLIRGAGGTVHAQAIADIFWYLSGGKKA